MKKQLLLSLTFMGIAGLNAETHPMDFGGYSTMASSVISNPSTKGSQLTSIKDTGHYQAIPTTMRVGQTFNVPSTGNGHPYDTWEITHKSGDAVRVINNQITAQTVGTSQIKVNGAKNNMLPLTAVKTIRVTK